MDFAIDDINAVQFEWEQPLQHLIPAFILAILGLLRAWDP